MFILYFKKKVGAYVTHFTPSYPSFCHHFLHILWCVTLSRDSVVLLFVIWQKKLLCQKKLLFVIWQVLSSQGLEALSTILSQSARVTLSVYVKPTFDPNGFQPILFKHKKSFDSQQLAALSSLYAWRDTIARQEDESVGYVLPNHMMISIAEVM